jgi:thiol-disulfide isomerase/thioredoxin
MLAALQKLFPCRPKTPPLEVTFYSKPDCPLCDKAETLLRRLQREYPMHVSKVNVTEHPDLNAAYGCKIPLIKIDGGNQLSLRITEERLRRALERAVARRRQSENHPQMTQMTQIQDVKETAA